MNNSTNKLTDIDKLSDKEYIDYLTNRNSYSDFSFDDPKLIEMMKQAQAVKKQNHSGVDFERSVFCTWSCKIADCKYCYMSIQGSKDETKVRSFASILAELMLCREYNWKVGYLTGGTGIIQEDKLFELCKMAHEVLGEKISINFGSMSKRQLTRFSEHVKGIGLAIETLDPKLHARICPSKPLGGLVRTLDNAKEVGMETFMTIILGVGESVDDFKLVEEFLTNHKIDKLQYCLLKPQPGTIYENCPEPNNEYMCWWISKTKLRFPKIKLKCAIVDSAVPDLDKISTCGIDSISRFPIIKQFGTEGAKIIADKINGFTANFSQIKDIDWQAKVNELSFDPQTKEDILKKVLLYDKQMRKKVAASKNSN